MNKLLNNKYIEHALKWAIVTLLCAMLYINVDTRDFMKYVQPERDKAQDGLINNVKEYCRTEVNVQKETNNNTHKRIDLQDDRYRRVEIDITEIKTYQRLILKKLNIIEQEQAINNQN